MNRFSVNAISWFLLILLVIMWGGSFSLSKIAVASIEPEWVATIRLILAGIVMFIFLKFTGRTLSSDPKAWVWFTVIGFVGNALPFFLVSWGLLHIPSSLSGIVMSTVPIFVLILATIFLGDEEINIFKICGIILGFVGVVILLGVENFLEFKFEGYMLFGQLATMIAAICYAIFTITGRHIRKYNFGRYETTAGVLIAGSIISFVLSYGLVGHFPSNIEMPSLISVIILGIFPTAIATIFLFYILEMKGALFLSLVNYGVPTFSVIIGILFMGEVLKLNVIIGMLIIMVALWVSEFMKTLWAKMG